MRVFERKAKPWKARSRNVPSRELQNENVPTPCERPSETPSIGRCRTATSRCVVDEARRMEASRGPRRARGEERNASCANGVLTERDGSTRTDRNEQEFKDCFPTIGPEFHDLLYDLYVQVVQSIRSNCRSEYSDIAQEHQIIEKLNMLDQMCEEQGVDGTDGSMPRPPPASVMPSQLARLERVKLKLKEKEALRDLLSEAEAQKAKATVALEARRKEVLVLKEKIQATEGGLEEVRGRDVWRQKNDKTPLIV